MGNKKKENYMDYIPKRNSLYQWKINDKNHVELEIHNKGLFHRIAQKFFKKPKISYVEMEDLGSFIWQTMDGELTVYEIGKKVKEEFGEKAEPLYERLVTYLRTLRENGFIFYVNKIK